MSKIRRAALAKLGIGAESQRREQPRKRNPYVLPAEVKCVLCAKTVPGKITRMIAIGRACKTHPGV